MISSIEHGTEPRPSTHDVMTFTCPRCQTTVQYRFYGPCADCARQLRSQVIGEAAEVVAAEYEPKMNVTPNAVALKED